MAQSLYCAGRRGPAGWRRLARRWRNKAIAPYDAEIGTVPAQGRDKYEASSPTTFTTALVNVASSSAEIVKAGVR